MYIKEILLNTNDLEQTALFYEERLELKIRYQDHNYISFDAGSSVLSFVKNERILHPVYHFAFNIPPNELRQAMVWLKTRVKLLPVNGNELVDFPRWNAHSMYFHDNNQNVLEWIARHDLKYEIRHSYSGGMVESISEIGLVADDVPLYAAKLSADYQIPVYPKQNPQENFAVLGTEQALLILSETGRDWFPTDIPGKKFPLKLTLGFERGGIEKTIETGQQDVWQ